MRRLAFAATLGLAFTLAACSPTPQDTISQSEAPIPVAVGDPVPSDFAPQPGQYAYHLPDGTQVLVEADQPLPASVKADLDAKASALAPVAEGDKMANAGAIADAQQVSRAAEQNTGHKVLVVIQTWQGVMNGNNVEYAVRYVIEGASAPSDGSLYASKYDNGLSKDTTIAFAQQWIASQPDADNWVLLVQ